MVKAKLIEAQAAAANVVPPMSMMKNPQKPEKQDKKNKIPWCEFWNKIKSEIN